MLDMLKRADTPYLKIYEALQEVRETFHREGRISDANAKLDETVKLLAIHYAHMKGIVDSAEFQTLFDRETFTVQALNELFRSTAEHDAFKREGMGSIFGSMPSTAFEEGDENIAYELFQASGRAFDAQSSKKHQLDILNEAFGHHIRDNFRSHVEDAQYMTPPEVVDFMVDLALEMLNPSQLDGNLIVADPSCGVGSFLTSCRSRFEERYGKEAGARLNCIGQDKVDRMVRLAAINLVFSDSSADDVFMGNTVQDNTPISKFDGKVDLILTNPPFGARFPVETLQRTSRSSTPFFANSLSTSKVIDSELLFIDRYLSLLRPGGLCFAVVPDGVISAKGIAAVLRQHLSRSAELVCVIELPPVTFAQAGTRTKTAILGFRKQVPRQSYATFFADVNDLGFQVSKRKGVTVKKVEGMNELPSVFEAFTNRENTVTSSGPACAIWRDLNPSACDAWTPRTMLFDRAALESRSPFSLTPLSELTSSPQKRRATAYTEKHYFISVLHVIGEGILDIPGIKSYQPITPGIPVEPGEVILSRINPRIPRVAVVPDLGRKLLCSSEYEVIRPKAGISPYLISFLLLSPFVQEQVQSLTAGTSASHSRIKPKKVYDVLLPNISNDVSADVLTQIKKYEEACKLMTSSLIAIEDIRTTLDGF